MRGAAIFVLALGCRPTSQAVPDEPPAPAPVSATVSATEAEPVASVERRVAKDVAVTILSTTLAGPGVGEWGFSALVEVDGVRILFDAGNRRDTVLRNAQTLGIDLSTVDRVVLSHHHDDHVGGLLTLRRSVVERRPEALATVHVARGIFAPRRYGAATREVNDMVGMRGAFEETGGRFVVHDGPAEIAPGVWVTGPVPRVFDILTHARQTIRPAPIAAAIGGYHLHKAPAAKLDWTAAHLADVDLHHLLGAHCTGPKPLRHFAEQLTTAEAEVGTRFEAP